MKSIRNFIIPFIASATIVSCQESADSKTSSNHETHSATDNKKESPAAEAAQIKEGGVNAIYQHYKHLTNALVNSDIAEAKIAASAIEAGAKEIPGGAAVAGSASKIVTAQNIEAQRKEYSTLSNQVIELVKKSGLKQGELYIDYCPMALNDKGAYWLSSTKDIRNPYFGDKMLTCGEVKESLN